MEGSRWAQFYEGRAGDGYLNYVKGRYAPFIAAIQASLRPADVVLEIGCGTATITRALWDQNIPEPLCFFATDKDLSMCQLAVDRLRGTSAFVLPMDASAPFKADVVHSHGMLEHFDDYTIKRIIRRHRGARVQVHYVPGLYDAPTFGDERLMSANEWQDICDPDDIIEFNGGLDYALVFK